MSLLSARMSASSSFERRLQWAQAQDAADKLSSLRQRFALPRDADGRELLYFCGHSLGLAPIAARAAVSKEFDHWEQLAVAAHHQADPAWIGYAESIQQPLADLAGAQVHEVVAMNSLSVNLHLLLASFYRPAGERRRILIEKGAFPSDRHVVTSQIAWHGGNPATDLVEVEPRDGEESIRQEDLEARIALEGGRLAVVLWPGVQYLSGQLFQTAPIARAAHAVDAIAGFDLAHAIGNVPLALHSDEADFAVWCSYKYLNAGPGAVGGAYIHERHLQRPEFPRLTGWWGHDPVTRFDMPPNFRPAAGAGAWAISNPPIFSTAPLRASLPLFMEAGMPSLRAKSKALTAYLEGLVIELAGAHLELVTAQDAEQRGCQLSLRLKRGAEHGRAVFRSLSARGIVADWREPNIIRLAPVPLYNSFEDVLRCAWQLADVLAGAQN
jgi:kynureninase